jgi:hypothetical protein
MNAGSGGVSAVRRTTYKDIGIGWWYWIVPAFFGAGGVGAFFAIRSEPQDKATLGTCGLFFATISLLALLWPILRVRERPGAVFISATSRRAPYRGSLIPVSNVKLIISVVGGSVLGIASGLGLLFADSLEHRAKAGIAFVVYLGFSVAFVRAVSKRMFGILLTEDGVIWNEVLLGTGLVPWSEVSDARAYVHQEKYSNAPSLGIRFRNLDALKLSRSGRRKLEENQRRTGWHCYYHAESLLLPLPLIEQAILFYKDHPEARWELVTGSAVDKMNRQEGAEASRIRI